ncbi:unnamed protein product [Dovyalis caffra]|uniref:Macrophage migration inhibitory factor n=1 Tax=Dovyalis caffra TaxID=77055 RepID=A0AAV1S3H4_9ROSI|nr:unnamed protein product [Dovyalis caffra]
MPALNISTNVSLDGVDVSAIQTEATSKLAKIIEGKTESDVMIVLRGSIPISLGGTQEPAAFGELVSIGGLGPEVNKNLSAAIAEILETKLSIPKPTVAKIAPIIASTTWFSFSLSMTLMFPLFCRVPTLGGMVPPSKSFSFVAFKLDVINPGNFMFA